MTDHNTSGVTADAKVLTRSGEQPIASLEGQTVDLWNGKTFEQMTITKRGQAKLCRARFEGPKGIIRVLDCTEGLRIPVGQSTTSISEATPFTRLRPFTLPNTTVPQHWYLVGISKRAVSQDVYCTSGIALINGLLVGF